MPNADRISELYKGHLWSDARPKARARIHWLVSQAHGSVLDVGCSQGITSILCARNGLSVIGVDNEADRIDYAQADREREPLEVQSRLRFELADATALEFADDSFDTVILGEILEHLADPAPVLREIQRVARPDGSIALTTPFGVNPHHDHRATFYVGSLLEALTPHLTVESMEIVDEYFRVVARPGAMDEEAKLHLLAGMQGQVEARFLETEMEERRLRGLAQSRQARARRLRRQARRRGRKLRRARRKLEAMRAERRGGRLRETLGAFVSAVRRPGRIARPPRDRQEPGEVEVARADRRQAAATNGAAISLRDVSSADVRRGAATRRRWVIYGAIRSRYAVESLITALRAANQEVVEVPSVSREHRYHRFDSDAEARRRIDAVLPADVVLNFRPEELRPGHIRNLRDRGVATVVWFADDPLLYKVCYRHVAEAYDLTLHTGREDVLRFYEERHGIRGYSFPFWTDEAHHPYTYDPDAADIEVGFLGNTLGPRRSERYDLLASLPWRVRFYGRLPSGAVSGEDPAGIHAGFLQLHEIPAGIRRFGVAINMAQSFVRISDRYSFTALDQFGEFFFPSRLVLYAAMGVPTVSLGPPGAEPPFPSVITAADREELIARVGALRDSRDTLLSTSAAAHRDFRACLSAETRVAMLLALLDGTRDHARATRADLWRQFAPAELSEPRAERVTS
jgi:ubiquinone/menaquinone biosynthesis C-methylase UbiE